MSGIGENCMTCRYWVQTNDKLGECHKNAPSPVTGGHPTATTRWPPTMMSDGCGEYQNIPK
jgi:hypothetical protein